MPGKRTVGFEPFLAGQERARGGPAGRAEGDLGQDGLELGKGELVAGGVEGERLEAVEGGEEAGGEGLGGHLGRVEGKEERSLGQETADNSGPREADVNKPHPPSSLG